MRDYEDRDAGYQVLGPVDRDDPRAAAIGAMTQFLAEDPIAREAADGLFGGRGCRADAAPLAPG